jgi:hypothetical protein
MRTQTNIVEARKRVKWLENEIESILLSNKNVTKWKSDVLLFKLRNDKKQAVTIIPGLNIDLIIRKLNDFELETLWYHIYVLYVSSVKIVSILNNIKSDDKAIVALPIFEERINSYNKKYGIDKYFNPYIGLKTNGTIDMDILIENAKKMPKDKSMINNLGLGNLVDIAQLDDQIKALNENDIKSTSNEISKILGADDNPDVKDICDLLVTEIFGNLKQTGIGGVFDTIENVQTKLKDTLGSKHNMAKMEKTKNQLDSFMKQAKEKVSQMKDEQGNPIGDNIMKMFGNDMLNQLQAKHNASLNK